MATKKKAKTSGQRLNRELLERARQQARANENEEVEDYEEQEVEEEIYARTTEPQPFAASPRRTTADPEAVGAARRAAKAKRIRDSNREHTKRGLTSEEISEMLANPTKIVPEAQLRAEYGFVLKDLRSMALLASASFVFLVVLAVLLPQ